MTNQVSSELPSKTKLKTTGSGQTDSPNSHDVYCPINTAIFGSNTYQKLSTSHKDVGFPCLIISHLVALSTSKNQIEAWIPCCIYLSFRA